jgi:RHS repeat-associated protein
VKESKYYYDTLSYGNVSKGNMTKEEIWKSGTSYADVEKTYNSYGLVTEEKDPRDKITSYVYDSYNLFVATSTNPIGQSADYYYDYSSGKIKKTIDPNGREFQTVYDALDRVIEEKQPDITTPSTLITKAVYEYSDSGLSRMVKTRNYLDSAVNFDKYSYLDGFNRVVQERKESEDANTYSVKDYVYNKLGLLDKETLPYFSSGASSTPIVASSTLHILYSYDPLQRITTVVNSVATTTNAYDDWKVSVTDGEGKVKDLYKDAYNNLIQVDEHNATSTYSTYYQYNLLNNLTKITDALENERDFTYDGLGQRLSAEDLHASGDGTYGIWEFTYDDSGNITSQEDPKNQTVNYTYDDINRTLTEDYAGGAGTDITYGYDWCADGKGRLCSATSTAEILNLSYNALGLVSSQTKTIDSLNFTTSYNYDRQGNQTLATYPNNTEIKHEFNSAGLLEKVLKKESGEENYSDVLGDIDYNPLAQKTYEDYSNGAAGYYSYNENEIYRLENKQTAIATSSIQDLSYYYDKTGNITKIEDQSDTNAAKTLDFIYDDLHRLTVASSTLAVNNQNFRQTYSCNAIGNITNKSDVGNYTYTDDGYNNPHAASQINGTASTYDNNGNLLNDGTWTHAWDYDNRIASSTDSNITLNYAYDHEGQRVKLSDGTTTTYYPDQYYSVSGATSTLQIFANGEHIATIEGNGTATSTYYIHTDHLGGTSAVSDESGAVVQNLDYFPFGGERLNEKAGSYDNEQKFAGYVRDEDSGLDYVGARYYNSNVGKWISQDPITVRLNRNEVYSKLYENQYSKDPNFTTFLGAFRPQKGYRNSIKEEDLRDTSFYYFLSDPQQLNSYNYVTNNPVLYIDENGEVKWGQLCKGVGRGIAALGGGTLSISAIISTGGVGAALGGTYVVAESGIQLAYGVNEVASAIKDEKFEAGRTLIGTIAENYSDKKSADKTEKIETAAGVVDTVSNPNPFKVLQSGLGIYENFLNNSNNSNNNNNFNNTNNKKHEVIKKK